MEGMEQARSLLIARKDREAAALLDRLLASDKENSELWYLRGVASLKLKNHDGALECLERALMLERKPSYLQIKGMVHFELFEMSEAVAAFQEALSLQENDAATHCFLSLCYLFLDDPKSDRHLQKALSLDPKKTKQLLLNFYTLFVKDEPRIGQAVKKDMADRIRRL